MAETGAETSGMEIGIGAGVEIGDKVNVIPGTVSGFMADTVPDAETSAGNGATAEAANHSSNLILSAFKVDCAD